MSCEGCATVFHTNCRVGLARCPTLGCVESSPRLVAATRPGGPGTGEGRSTSFAAALLTTVATGLAALGGGVLVTAYVYEDGYLPGLTRAAFFVLLAVHFLYSPARWAIVRRRSRTVATTLVRVLVGELAALVGAALFFFLASTGIVPFFFVGAIVVFIAPAVGAWHAAGPD